MGDQIDSHGPSQYCDLEQTIMSPVFFAPLGQYHRAACISGFASTMTVDQFWKIIEDVHQESGTDIDRRFEVLEAELGKLSLAEVQSFDVHFTDCLDRAFTWELWWRCLRDVRRVV